MIDFYDDRIYAVTHKDYFITKATECQAIRREKDVLLHALWGTDVCEKIVKNVKEKMGALDRIS